MISRRKIVFGLSRLDRSDAQEKPIGPMIFFRSIVPLLTLADSESTYPVLCTEMDSIWANGLLHGTASRTGCKRCHSIPCELSGFYNNKEETSFRCCQDLIVFVQ